jgi:hypothetical protein
MKDKDVAFMEDNVRIIEHLNREKRTEIENQRDKEIA